ncbi:hypothetical protein BB560_001992 [Smittium megazygosporum]|uniref:VLRF1 domain-containing protein n=1 Tax=Smittium megazygosporum TaxID=133381 RepID=A0A2T9ZG13_9FUNG|nr:hypothetical protein BB560_001992 [Smittium megazygosporum]
MKNSGLASFTIFHFPKAILDAIYESHAVAGLTTKSPISRIQHVSNPLLPKDSESLLNKDLDSERPISSRPSCALCGIPSFASVSEQRSHFKSEKHNINLSNKLKNRISESSNYSNQSPAGFTSSNLNFKKSSSLLSEFDSSNYPSESHGEVSETHLKPTAKVWLGQYKSQSSKLGNDPNPPLEQKSDELIQYGVFKAVLYDRKLKNKTRLPYMVQQLSELQLPPYLKSKAYSQADSNGSTRQYWAILQVSGGHFAGGIFDNTSSKLIAHKTFHRYTTRRKQGKSQLSHDKAKGYLAKSAGAQLRRYNEQKLLEDIKNTISGWSHYLKNCSRIFQTTSKASRKIFFGDESSPVPYESQVIRVCPIQVKRPSLSEVERVYKALTAVFTRQIQLETNLSDPSNAEPLQEEISSQIEAISNSSNLDSNNEESGNSINESDDDSYGSDSTLEPEPRPELVEFLYNAAAIIQDARKTEEQVLAFLKSKDEMLLDSFLDPATDLRYLEKCPKVNGSKTPTLLHIAALQGRAEVILFLLDHGDDPSITNGHPPLYSGGKTAYELSKDKPTRDVFRKFRFDNEKIYTANDGTVIASDDKHSEWNDTRIPKGWKPPPVQLNIKQGKKIDENANRGILDQVQGLNTPWAASTPSLQFQSSGAVNSFKSIISPTQGSSSNARVLGGRLIRQGNTDDKKDADIQRELRARAAEARFAKLSKK